MKHSVLFIDDNPVTLKTIEKAFLDEEYDVRLCENATEALDLVKVDWPHVIVSDLKMPDMSGLTLLHKARRINPHFIGMIFTAYLDFDAVMQAVSDEAVWRYIAKPWKDNRELVLAVRNAFQLYEAMADRRQVEEQLNRTERLAALGHLVAGIAHQFNNINVGILGYAQLAQANKDLSDDVRECLVKIREFTKRGTEIVKELSAFSDQSSQWGFSPGNLVDVVTETVSFMRKEIEAAGIEIELKLEPCEDAVVNYGLVKQLISHLLTNARHALVACEHGKITVETVNSGDRVFVRVSDNGCGIPNEYVKKIFDPFFTTKGAQAVSGSPQAGVHGVGLGLTLSQTVAESHNGELVVDSEKGVGTSFTFYLPVA